jgi:serine/threonine-protein kinase
VIEQDATVQQALDAALNGEHVDWEKIESSLTDPADSETLKKLRLILGIADFCRGQQDVAPADQINIPAVETSDPRAPTRTWGRLEIRRELGVGGYGTVYLAWDPKLRRDVALKLYKQPQPLPGESFRSALETFLGEARMAAQVKHPNVVTIYDTDEHDGTVGMWMEYVPGKTLHQLIRERGPMEWRAAAKTVRSLCDAITAVHGSRIIHRDITAKNVMLEDSGRIVLMDFGIGRDIPGADSRSADRILGTPQYMAPEIFTRGKYSTATDTYSVGILLHYLLTGEYPGAFGDRSLLLRRKGIPAALGRVVERALAIDPGHRPGSTEEIGVALDGILAKPGGDPRLRKRLVVVVVSMVGALLIAFLGVRLSNRDGAGSDGKSTAPSDGMGRVDTSAVIDTANPSEDAVKAQTRGPEGPVPQTSGPDSTIVHPSDRETLQPIQSPTLAAGVVVEPEDGSCVTRFRFHGRVEDPRGEPLPAIRYRWDWNSDGEWDTEPAESDTISHQYARPGRYRVVMKAVVAPDQEDTASCSVLVQATPTAAFSFLPSLVTTADTVSFDASASKDADSPDSSLTASWSWGPGNTWTSSLTTEIVRHRFSEPTPEGIRVRLLVEDSDGLADTASRVIRVEPYRSPDELVKLCLGGVAAAFQSMRPDLMEECYCGQIPARDRAVIDSLFSIARRVTGTSWVSAPEVEAALGVAAARLQVDFIHKTTNRADSRFLVRLNNKCARPGWWVVRITRLRTGETQ